MPGGLPLERLQFIASVRIQAEGRFVSGQAIGRGTKGFDDRLDRLRVPHQAARSWTRADRAIASNMFDINAARDGVTRHRALPDRDGVGCRLLR